ncbi:MAG TPA: PLP-dependent aminotransferase family protein [Blastocatellia bacterium]|nr:PLP-dependent aminotransferase family protein [Blastocatellia bacterium]
MSTLNSAPPRYVQIARSLESSIRTGTLRAGEKAPSIRALSRQRRVSISTAMHAYLWLERRGLLEARPRSGFYIRVPEPAVRNTLPCTRTIPKAVGVRALFGHVIRDVADPSNLQLAIDAPRPGLLPADRLNVIIRDTIRRNPGHSSHYQCPLGSEFLRRQIARRALRYGCELAEDDLIVTAGATEALSLALRAITRPGDAVAVESPADFSLLQSIESLGLTAIEVPTDSELGMDLEYLDRLARKRKPAACIAMPNCQNPLGYVLPGQRKRELVDLITRRGIPLIENDVSGDLAFSGRPEPAKSFDTAGLVILLSSFSRVLCPGFRVGWVSGGRFHDAIGRLKFTSSLSTASLQQLVVARFLESGEYERHIRRLSKFYHNQLQVAIEASSTYFPAGTRFTRPAGGSLLWIELPPGIRGLDLYAQALQHKIAILPGELFSSGARFSGHFRISCGGLRPEELEPALKTLGDLCYRMLEL